jgi:hypothetical protein
MRSVGPPSGYGVPIGTHRAAAAEEPMQPPVLHAWPPEPVLRATAWSLMRQCVAPFYYSTTTQLT